MEETLGRLPRRVTSAAIARTISHAASQASRNEQKRASGRGRLDRRLCPLQHSPPGPVTADGPIHQSPPTSTFPAQPLLSALTGARVRVGDGFGCDGPDHLAAEPAARSLAESAPPIGRRGSDLLNDFGPGSLHPNTNHNSELMICLPIHLLVGLALGVVSPPFFVVNGGVITGSFVADGTRSAGEVEVAGALTK